MDWDDCIGNWNGERGEQSEDEMDLVHHIHCDMMQVDNRTGSEGVDSAVHTDLCTALRIENTDLCVLDLVDNGSYSIRRGQRYY